MGASNNNKTLKVEVGEKGVGTDKTGLCVDFPSSLHTISTRLSVQRQGERGQRWIKLAATCGQWWFVSSEG